MTPLLDKLETFFTRRNKCWEQNRVSPFAAWFSPSLLVRQGEDFTVSLYVREALTQSFCIATFQFLVTAFTFGMIYRDVHNDPGLVAILRPMFLSRLLDTVLAAAITIAFAFLFRFPFFYFWNRRAKRLRAQPDEPAPPVVSVVADPTVWPPPPNFTQRP